MMNKATNNPPYRTLDAWRGLASLAVVFYHVAQMVARGQTPEAGQSLLRVGSFGSLGVQLFFVISGYCIASAAFSVVARGQGVWQFLGARVRRVYPPCWFALALAWLFFEAGGLLASRGLIHGNVFTQMDLLHAGAAYYASNLTLTQILCRQPILLAVCWTLCYEVAFYAIFALVLAAALRPGRPSAMLPVLHALTVITLLWLIVAPRSVVYPFDLWPQFGLGVLVYDVLRRRGERSSWVWLGLSGALTLAFVARYDGPMGYMQQAARLTFPVSLVFALLLIGLHRHDAALSRRRVVGALASVGLFSYSLYLTHTITIRAVNQLAGLAHAPLGVPAVACVVGVAAVTASVLFARAFYQFCERPFLKSASRRVRTRPEALPVGGDHPARVETSAAPSAEERATPPAVARPAWAATADVLSAQEGPG